MKLRFAQIAAVVGAAVFGPTAAYGQAQGCGLQSLNGAYAFRSLGTFPGGTPSVFVGTDVFDGKGNLLGPKTTGSFGGNIYNGPPVTGSYTVNSDCTGTITMNIAPGVYGHWDIVIADNGKTFFAVVTDAQFVLSMEAVKQ
jgi:hypothetical protein